MSKINPLLTIFISIFTFLIALIGFYYRIESIGKSPFKMITVIIVLSIMLSIATVSIKKYLVTPHIRDFSDKYDFIKIKSHDLSHVNSIGNKIFNDEKYYLDDLTFEELYRSNPNGFVALRKNYVIIGYYVILALKDEASNKMSRGTLKAKDLAPSMLTTFSRCKSLHVMDVICKGSKFESGILLFNLKEFLLDIMSKHSNILYISAHSINKISENILESRGFKQKTIDHLNNTGRKLWVYKKL